MNKKVLLIDDESRIQHFIGISLAAEGFDYLGCTTGEEGLRRLTEDNPDLVILDLGLPDLDGFQVLRRIREASKVPVLILTARDEEDEKVRLLEAGANDYLSKPFGIKELIVRIRVMIRDLGYTPLPKVINSPGLRIHPHERSVEVDGQTLSLTRKEHALLIHLVSSPGQLIPYEVLLTDIWGQSHREDSHYLRILVNQLRKKLGDDSGQPRYIRTEPGVGYQFIAETRAESHD